MAKKYRLYECPFDTLPKNPYAVYSHYENGRMLVLYAHRKPSKQWRVLSDKEITKLSPHERRWYLQSKNEINAEYLKSPEAEEQQMKYVEKLLKKYEENIKQIIKAKAEVKNAENETNRNDG